MMTKIEMEAMEAVIGMRKEMAKANEIDWEQRRYELAKSALLIAPMLSKDGGPMTPELIAKYAVEIADATVMELIKTEK
ncbi:MAG: hypothetical protein SO013_09530 [Prevotella sp.]|nr:hypothetical protein [Prevotella sp.]